MIFAPSGFSRTTYSFGNGSSPSPRGPCLVHVFEGSARPGRGQSARPITGSYASAARINAQRSNSRLPLPHDNLGLIPGHGGIVIAIPATEAPVGVETRPTHGLHKVRCEMRIKDDAAAIRCVGSTEAADLQVPAAAPVEWERHVPRGQSPQC
jgi:hypothetical protein